MYFSTYDFDKSAYRNAKDTIKNNSVVYSKDTRMYKTLLPEVCTGNNTLFEAVGNPRDSGEFTVIVKGTDYLQASGSKTFPAPKKGIGPDDLPLELESVTDLALDPNLSYDTDSKYPTSGKVANTVFNYKNNLSAELPIVGSISVKPTIDLFKSLKPSYISKIKLMQESYISSAYRGNEWADMNEMSTIFDKAKIVLDGIEDDEFGLVAMNLELVDKVVVGSGEDQKEDYLNVNVKFLANTKNIDIDLERKYSRSNEFFIDGYVNGYMSAYMKMSEDIGFTMYEGTPFEEVTTKNFYVEALGREYSEVNVPVYTDEDEVYFYTKKTIQPAVAVSNAFNRKIAYSNSPKYVPVFTEDMINFATGGNGVEGTREYAIENELYTNDDAFMEAVRVIIQMHRKDSSSNPNEFKVGTGFYMSLVTFKELFRQYHLRIKYETYLYNNAIQNDNVARLIEYGIGLDDLLSVDWGRISEIWMSFKVVNCDGASYFRESDKATSKEDFHKLVNVLGNRAGKVLMPVIKLNLRQDGEYNSRVLGYVLNWEELAKLDTATFCQVLNNTYGYINTHMPKKKRDIMGTIIQVGMFVVLSVVAGPAGSGLWSTLYYTGVAVTAVGMLTGNSTLMTIGSVLMVVASIPGIMESVKGFLATGLKGGVTPNTILKAMTYTLKVVDGVRGYRYGKEFDALRATTDRILEEIEGMQELITQNEEAERVGKFIYSDVYTDTYASRYTYSHEYKYM